MSNDLIIFLIIENETIHKFFLLRLSKNHRKRTSNREDFKKKKNSLILPWTIIEQWIETISPRYGRKKEATFTQRSQKSPSDSSNRGWTIRFWNSAKWKWIHINQRDRWNLGQVHRGQELYADRGRSKVKRENPLSEKSCSKAKSFPRSWPATIIFEIMLFQ